LHATDPWTLYLAALTPSGRSTMATDTTFDRAMAFPSYTPLGL